MATLAISKDFLNEFAKLQPRARAKVQEHADTFARLDARQLRELKGLRLKSHTNSADPRARTIRVDDNHRGIVMDAGNDELFILMSVGTHDETDRWMANNTFKVNAATGALEVLNVEAVRAEVESIVPSESATKLFEHRKDKDFTQLGIDPDVVLSVRAFTTEDQLSGLIGYLPPGQADALIQLTGETSVEAIYADIAGQQTSAPIDTEDIVAAIEAPASRSNFRVVDDQAERSEIFSQPLAQWRIFLHPSQDQLVQKETYNGPVRVTGGAGTGKTVVAMHRTKVLVERLEDRSGTPILFTTYTRNLAQAIEQDLRNLAGGDALDVVDVKNVDRIAYQIVQDAEGSGPNLPEKNEVQELWQRIVDERGLEFSPEFLNNEWEQVILAQDCKSRSDYFEASRTGRGIPLDRRSRAGVWKAVESFTRALADGNKRTYLQMASDAAGYVAGRSIKPYKHVIVDEAQDLHEAQWRLLRAIVEEVPNDMFIVGDSHQRIYDRRSSLSKVGINIRGRSKKLKINYRTTHEVLAWSLALLGEGEFDDLDGGEEKQDFAGYHSYRHGPAPVMSGHDSKQEQLDELVKQINQWVSDGVHEESIGVAARSRGSFDAVTRALEKAGRTVCVLPTELPRAIGVRIGTMHRMKGLEFERVAIVDVDDRSIPAPIALTDPEADQVQYKTDLQRELCLLYVAATRARDGLWVGWSGTPSRFLGVFDRATK